MEEEEEWRNTTRRTHCIKTLFLINPQLLGIPLSSEKPLPQIPEELLDGYLLLAKEGYTFKHHCHQSTIEPQLSLPPLILILLFLHSFCDWVSCLCNAYLIQYKWWTPLHLILQSMPPSTVTDTLYSSTLSLHGPYLMSNIHSTQLPRNEWSLLLTQVDIHPLHLCYWFACPLFWSCIPIDPPEESQEKDRERVCGSHYYFHSEGKNVHGPHYDDPVAHGTQLIPNPHGSASFDWCVLRLHCYPFPHSCSLLSSSVSDGIENRGTHVERIHVPQLLPLIPIPCTDNRPSPPLFSWAIPSSADGQWHSYSFICNRCCCCRY